VLFQLGSEIYYNDENVTIIL